VGTPGDDRQQSPYPGRAMYQLQAVSPPHRLTPDRVQEASASPSLFSHEQGWDFLIVQSSLHATSNVLADVTLQSQGLYDVPQMNAMVMSDVRSKKEEEFIYLLWTWWWHACTLGQHRRRALPFPLCSLSQRGALKLRWRWIVEQLSA
jgi:hypothetical protein